MKLNMEMKNKWNQIWIFEKYLVSDKSWLIKGKKNTHTVNIKNECKEKGK